KYSNILLVAVTLISSTFAIPESYSNDRCGKEYGECDPGYCCSQYGWCGTTSEHCGKGCQSEFGDCENKPVISKDDRCGPENGNTVCGNGKCCSKYGWCGTSSEHCGKGCQSEFGKCENSITITKTKTKTKTTTSIKSSSTSSSKDKWDTEYGRVDKEARVYAQEIWDFLVEKIGNKNGAAGVIGNLYAESRLQPADLQEKYEIEFGLNDKEYTKAVDNGSYTKFTTDKGGYGLVQWTSENRKTNLLNYCKKRGTSIGDLYMQLDFLWLELTTTKKYENLLKILKTTDSIQEASDVVVLEFEIPEKRGQDVLNKRAKFGRMLKAACDH
ncbi:carbohydrate-binding module family 18 protein, partial [Piromyces sp. E2]